MRFTGERTLEAATDDVWTALHDHEVLRRAIPGCRDLAPIGPGDYAATLGVQVGPLADTYRGRFTHRRAPAESTIPSASTAAGGPDGSSSTSRSSCPTAADQGTRLRYTRRPG